MILTRTHPDYDTHLVVVANKRDARQHVAWCATDNLAMSRRDATDAANAYAADLDEPYRLGPYTFVLTKEPTP